jgi:hypothetical protein
MKYRATEKAARGNSIQTDFGRDTSNVHGSDADEQAQDSVGGSPTNLDHSIKNGGANQTLK